MCSLSEIQNYLSNTDMSRARIEECYNLITSPCDRVNTEDEQWVACEQEHERLTVYDAIESILTNAGYNVSSSNITQAVQEVCSLFEESSVTNKPRIVFYVLVLDQLIA